MRWGKLLAWGPLGIESMAEADARSTGSPYVKGYSGADDNAAFGSGD